MPEFPKPTCAYQYSRFHLIHWDFGPCGLRVEIATTDNEKPQFFWILRNEDPEEDGRFRGFNFEGLIPHLTDLALASVMLA